MRALALAAALAGCGHAQKGEPALVLPPYPRAERLIEIFVSPTSELRFFVDPASVEPGSDGAVRYTLVARSPAGAENVSYEALRCESGEARIYAVGRNGEWVLASSDWRASRTPWQAMLYRDYFCPLRQPIASREEGVRVLRSGGR